MPQAMSRSRPTTRSQAPKWSLRTGGRPSRLSCPHRVCSTAELHAETHSKVRLVSSSEGMDQCAARQVCFVRGKEAGAATERLATWCLGAIRERAGVC